MAEAQLFEPGRNAWRVERAERAAFIVDGDDYFGALAEAARHAQRSILIAGWDFHSRTPLAWDENGGKAADLGKFLNDLVRAKRSLHVHILIWDYPMIFGLDREWAPIYGLGWKPKRRVHLRYDNTHPVGGSHHQKLVVIDDALAFCGGIDLTCRRWDTCAHKAEEPRRTVENDPYPPFHDMMMAVEGNAAQALGDLVRERWRRATGETLKPPPRPRASAWPAKLQPQVTGVDVAISRTEPAANGHEGVREIEELYIDMIRAARRTLYIENQYFTADRVGNALEARLQEPDGPEIVVVLRKLSHGWLEELTMESLRTRLIDKLRRADHAGRLKVFFPFIEGLKEGTCIDIHSKLIIVDDDLLRIGSSNLANRSMGLDTECDLSIQAGGREEVSQAIRTFRNSLLAEHLGAEPAQVESAIRETGTLAGAIERLHHEDRTLKELTDLPEIPEAVLNMASVADPERPVELSDLMKVFNSDVSAKEASAPWGKVAAAALVLLGLTALWRYTPLSEMLEASRITGWAREAGSKWWAPLVTVFAYTPACLVMFPRPLITLFAVVAFGPWLGFLYAMAGVELAAWFTFLAGERLKRDTVRRVAGSKLNAVIEVMRRRGLIAMTALRLVPLAPFAVEGVVAGAVGVKLWHFMLGTLIGITPGTLAATVFGNELQSALDDPGKVNYWLIGGALAVVVVATLLVRRWLTASANASPTARHASSGTQPSDVGSARVA